MTRPSGPPSRLPPTDEGRYGSTQPMRRSPGSGTPRRRMMAQGRKAHFMHDAKAVLLAQPTKFDDVTVRPFLETMFQRGTRQSTDDALNFLDTKVADETVTKDQGNALANLIERYSFWR